MAHDVLCPHGMLDNIVEYHHLRSQLRRGRWSRLEARRLAQLDQELRVSPLEVGHRRWRRRDVCWRADLQTLWTTRCSFVLDVCAGGFRVVGDLSLRHNEYVELVVHRSGASFRFPCRVVWLNPEAREYGLAIDGQPTRASAGGATTCYA